MVLLGLVLALVSQVTATPYGYGVKGGAVAKAEASASAGAFSGSPPIPLAIPSGAGYSGSFSKSSSSSFASSSASASSSSFTFSGGNAINGFGSNGGCSSGACNGCSTGACKNNGANDLNLSSNNGQTNTAEAAAAAGSSPYNNKHSNQPCDGGNCNENEENKGCDSGQCGNNRPSNNGLNNDGSTNDCTNGDCSSSTNTQRVPNTNCKSGICGNENTPTNAEQAPSNDIYVNVAGKSQAHNNYNNLPTQNSYTEEVAKNGDSGPCYNGICKPASQTLSPYSNYGGNNIGNTLQTNSDKQQQNKASDYGKPSTIEPECTTHDCVSQSQNAGNDRQTRPSSYDVPIFVPTIPSNIPEKEELCTSDECQNNNFKNTFTNDNFDSTRPGYNNSPVPKSPSDCSGGVCTSQTIPKTETSAGNHYKPFTPSYGVHSGDHSRPSASLFPNAGIQSNQPTFNTPQNCGPSGCSNNPQTGTTFSQNQHGYGDIQTSLPSSEHFSSSAGQPGCRGSNCDASSSSSVGVNTNLPSFNSPGNCGSLGCDNIPQTGAPNPQNQHGSFGSTKPSAGQYFPHIGRPDCKGLNCATPSFSNADTYTKQPIFTGPGNCGSAGCSSIPQTGSSFPHNQPGYGGIGLVTPSTPFGSTGRPGCKGPNCGTSYFPSLNINTNQPSYITPGNCGPSGCTPQAGTTPSQNQPGYGSAGISETTSNKDYQTGLQSWSTQSTLSPFTSGAVTSSPFSPSYKPNPSVVSPNTELAPPNENSQPGIHYKPFDLSKADKFDANKNTQVYTGGFGGSKGPIDQNVNIKPHRGSTVSPASSPGAYSSHLPSTPQYRPTNPGLSSHSQIPISSTPVSPAPGAEHDHKKIPYTGGFNGPSGFLKPNDYSIPSTGFTPKSSSRVPCSSNNCGSTLSHSTSLAGSIHNGFPKVNAQASASAVAYTGGFGGPPGFLKAYDDGKNTGHHSYNANPSSSLQGAQGSLNTNLGYNNHKQAGNGVHESGTSPLFNQAGAVALANAVATSSAGAHGGSNGGGVKGCSQGCVPANEDGAKDGLGNDVNAAAIASAKSAASSFGIGGSYSSSSASAHASAGAATKGGYGRR